MNNANTFEFFNCCRVCTKQAKNMISVFSPEGCHIIGQVENCTGVIITIEDGLPTKLCMSCISNLAVAHQFRTDCLNADATFRNILKESVLAEDVIKKEEKDENYLTVNINDGNFEIQGPNGTNQGIKIENYDDDDNANCGSDNLEYKFQPTVGTRPKTLRKTSKIKTKNKAAKKKKKTDNTNVSKSKDGLGNVKRKGEPKSIPKTQLSPERLEKKKRLGRLYCAECDIVFESRQLTLQHKIDKHACDVICEICGQKFLYRGSLPIHLKSHFPPTYNCSKCDYSTCYKNDLRKHMPMHEEKQFVCEYCTRSFRYMQNLREHTQRVHLGGLVKKFDCPRCGKKFGEKWKMIRHMETHDTIKRYECEVCHVRLGRRDQWKIHLEKAHNITVPKLKSGRRRKNVIIGALDSRLNLLDVKET